MRRAAWVSIGIAAIAAMSPASSSAHPLGNFTVNRFSALEISPTQVRIRYAADIAEVPTFQELAKIDADGDGIASDAELSAYATSKSTVVRDGLRLTFDEMRLELGVESATSQLFPGEGGLKVLRLDVNLVAAMPSPRGTLVYADENFGVVPGWREIVATGVDGERILSTDVPSKSVSDGLRAYPESMLRSPLKVSSARVVVEPGPDVTLPPSPTPTPAPREPRDRGSSRFLALVDRDLSFSGVLAALLIAYAFGAGHALGPGHGKTVTAAFLLGRDARALHALAIGGAVAAMHTFSVLALGIAAVALTESVPAATVYPWLALVTGLVVLAVGVGLVVKRRTEGAHDHGHAHDHPHPMTRRGIAAIALSGGLLPSPGAVVVLLGAISLGRTAFGLALVLAFSAGLATALAVVGVLALRARDLGRSRLTERLARAVPTIAAGLVVAMGAYLTARATIALVTA